MIIESWCSDCSDSIRKLSMSITPEEEKKIEDRIEQFQKTKGIGTPSNKQLKELVMGEIRIHQFFDKNRQAEWDSGYTKGFADGKTCERSNTGILLKGFICVKCNGFTGTEKKAHEKCIYCDTPRIPLT